MTPKKPERPDPGDPGFEIPDPKQTRRGDSDPSQEPEPAHRVPGPGPNEDDEGAAPERDDDAIERIERR